MARASLLTPMVTWTQNCVVDLAAHGCFESAEIATLLFDKKHVL